METVFSLWRMSQRAVRLTPFGDQAVQLLFVAVNDEPDIAIARGHARHTGDDGRGTPGRRPWRQPQ